MLQKNLITMTFIKYALIHPKPYCKVCRDAGKTEAEYTNHFVKSIPGPAGKVVCPTLLSQQCRYCHVKGHTSNYCSQAKKDQTIIQYNEKIKTLPQEKTAPPKAPSNKFAALMDENSDSENDSENNSENDSKLITRKMQKPKNVVEEFPVLFGTTPKIQFPTTTTISYAAKTAIVKPKVHNERNEAFNLPVLKPVFVPPQCKMQKPIDVFEEFPVLFRTNPKIQVPIFSYSDKIAIVQQKEHNERNEAFNLPVFKPVSVPPQCKGLHKIKPDLLKTSWADDDAWASSDSEADE